MSNTDMTKPDPQDMLWEDNHQIILEKWELIYNQTGKRPTQVAIAKETGLSRQCVANHLKRMKFDLHVTPKHFLNLDSALDKLYEIGIEGDTKALVEFIKLVGNPSQKREVSTTSTNKTLKVTFAKKEGGDIEKSEEVEFEEITTDDDL